MTLENLGYNDNFAKYRIENNLDSFDIGRVTTEHRDRYIVKTETKELDCELIGNLRYTATDKSEWPSVGDWVAICPYDEGKALIHAVYPRYSTLERKAVGKSGQSQVIAVNIDVGLIIQSVNRDLSINRLERYMTICNASHIEPIIVLSKIDLLEETEFQELFAQVKERISTIPIIGISNQTQIGIDQLKLHLFPGKTFCLLGSSGVGKSTLINSLLEKELMPTGEISASIDRGKHVTTHRELIVSEYGILIDNPGMREIGITDASSGIEQTFDEIMELSNDCKHNDCTHINEDGCSVLDAIENGSLNIETHENFLRMEREKNHYESDAREKKKKSKDLGKLIKNMKINHGKY